MPSKEQVKRTLAGGTDYVGAGRVLGIPAGQAYMLMTGTPADGSGTTRSEEVSPGFLPSSQHLVYPAAENPTAKGAVHEWIARRAAEQGGASRRRP